MSHAPDAVQVSVLVCTYNPDLGVLQRCLTALRTQTLAQSRWELLLIDNCSAVPLDVSVDISWHRLGRHLKAAPLGKTHAIKLGTREAAGQILLVVDDDNILAPDYLELAVQIMADYPFLGVIGGNKLAEFERTPSPWTERYHQLLALGGLGEHPLYICSPDKTYVPPGAGMTIRKRIVDHYLEQIENDMLRQGLDPVGDQLSRAGDVDMALCAWDLHLAKGYFPSLILTHVIPSARLQLEYLARLFEGSAYCDTLLLLTRGMIPPEPKPTPLCRFTQYLRWRISIRHLTAEQVFVERAGRRGTLRAHRSFADIG